MTCYSLFSPHFQAPFIWRDPWCFLTHLRAPSHITIVMVPYALCTVQLSHIPLQFLVVLYAALLLPTVCSERGLLAIVCPTSGEEMYMLSLCTPHFTTHGRLLALVCPTLGRGVLDCCGRIPTPSDRSIQTPTNLTLELHLICV